MLREIGDDQGARRVLYEMERIRRLRDPSYLKICGWLLGETIGYGYYPLKAAVWLLVLASLGHLLFSLANIAGFMVPTDKDAYGDYRRDKKPPAHYEDFSPFIFSLENSLPLVKLGQADKWQPDPHPECTGTGKQKPVADLGHQSVLTGSLRGFQWFQNLVGSLLAALFVAGVTGIVSKE